MKIASFFINDSSVGKRQGCIILAAQKKIPAFPNSVSRICQTAYFVEIYGEMCSGSTLRNTKSFTVFCIKLTVSTVKRLHGMHE